MTLLKGLLASSFALFLVAGCGDGGGSNGGSGGTTATGGSGGTTATGGSGGSTGGSGGTTATGGSGGSTGGSGGAGACNGTITVAIDNGAPQTLSSTCNGNASDLTDTALGYVFAGGAVGSPHGIRIVGCTTAQPAAQGVIMEALDAGGTGTYPSGNTYYTDENGDVWGVPNDPFEMTLTKVDPTGGVIEGTFSVVVTHGGNAAHSLSGSFHVCHVNDQLAP